MVYGREVVWLPLVGDTPTIGWVGGGGGCLTLQRDHRALPLHL